MDEYSLGLRKATDEELDSIIEKTLPYLPQTFAIHCLLSVGFRLKLVDRNYTRIYLPVSEKIPFFIIITGIITKRNRNNLTPFWDPNEISIPNAKTLMKSLPNWNWEQPVLFDQIAIPTFHAIKEIMLGEGGLGNDKLDVEFEEGYTYTLSPENIINKSLAEKTFLATLTEEYAPLVFKHSTSADTIEGIEGYLKSLPSMAAFVKIDSNENCDNHDLNPSKEINAINGHYKPVSWAITRLNGEIGFSYTLPEYRNKGLCAAATLALAKELIKMKITPYVSIFGNKPAAVKAHENIGFRKNCSIGYQIYFEKGMTGKDY